MGKFTMNDLQNGDIVVLRDGMKGVYICRAADHDVILMSCGSFMHRHNYNNNLTCPENDKCDILKVYRGAKCFNECETTKYLVYNGEWLEETKSEEVTPDKYIRVVVVSNYDGKLERFINSVGYDNILQIMPTTNYHYTIIYKSELAIDLEDC